METSETKTSTMWNGITKTVTKFFHDDGSPDSIMTVYEIGAARARVVDWLTKCGIGLSNATMLGSIDGEEATFRTYKHATSAHEKAVEFVIANQ